jgi:hypothetical protein
MNTSAHKPSPAKVRIHPQRATPLLNIRFFSGGESPPLDFFQNTLPSDLIRHSTRQIVSCTQGFRQVFTWSRVWGIRSRVQQAGPKEFGVSAPIFFRWRCVAKQLWCRVSSHAGSIFCLVLTPPPPPPPPYANFTKGSRFAATQGGGGYVSLGIVLGSTKQADKRHWALCHRVVFNPPSPNGH